MKLATFVALLFLAGLPSKAGTLFSGLIDSTLAAPTSAGVYGAGLTLTIGASGTANLNAPSTLIITNPDGSMTTPVSPASCTTCWAPGYQYFIEGNAYPTVAGGNGTNTFSGGGGNYDAFPGTHSAWAAEGKQTTDTTDPGAIRFGALAYAFVQNPTDIPAATSWLPLVQPLNGGGFGNTISSGNGGTLLVVVVDTYYPNNSGSYNLTVSASDVATPEPAVTWLICSGLGLFGLARMASRRRVH